MDREKAIEVLKDFWSVYKVGTEIREAFEVLIPELKESEDERIRKNCIHFLELQKKYHASTIEIDECVSWLEKQGEKNKHTKHPDMVANLKEYLANTPKEQLEKDWDELKHWNNVGPTVEEFLYGKQKPTWSEEDEYQINTILHGLDLKREIYKKEGNKVEEERYSTRYEWLKSLKERYTWKPSDEQMEYLTKTITTLGKEGYNKTSAILYELRTDLKKLKG